MVTYKNIIEGKFLNRPNRFIGHVLINEKEEVAHVRNTGRCKEILLPSAKVLLEDHQNNPKSKTKYSLISVYKQDMLINIDSQVPNQVVYQAILKDKIKGLNNIVSVKKEATFNKSRFDIYFENEKEKGYMEIKGVTLEEDGIAMFPDAPTLRGKKHLQDLIQAKKQGYRAIVFFLIQMKGPKLFKINKKRDPAFYEAIKEAKEKGVEILVYDSIVTKDYISLDQEINFDAT